MGSLLGKALGLRNLATPIPLAGGSARWSLPGLAGGDQQEGYMRAMGTVGTVWQIVHLLSSNTAKPEWRLYRKQHRDGRVRYTTNDQGSDQRTEVLKHQALSVLLHPNPFYSRFTLMEAAQQYLELTGESWWVVDRDPRSSIPLGLWPVRPDRMDPVPDPEKYLKGYIYSAPDGIEKIPLHVDEVVMVKYPNPLDPYRGLGPVQAVLVDVDAFKYSGEWNRNYFINSAEPGGVIQVDHKVEDDEWNDLTNRWREAHRGTARSHRVAVLEGGQTWVPNQHTLRDMDFKNLRDSGRDIIREAWGVHKIMLGNSDDVNRANAQTGEEVFANWSVAPRLDRWKEALNNQFLPLFYPNGEPDVEFDYLYPLPQNREQDNAELTAKSTAAQVLVAAGFDPDDVLEVVGLPQMDYAGPPVLPPTPATVPPTDTGESEDNVGDSDTGNAWRAPIWAKKDSAAKVYQMLAKDYPVDQLGWIHYAQWMGPLDVPQGHVDMSGAKNRFNRAESDIDHFKDEIGDKGKTKPVVLVKRPGITKLFIVDGHARTLAYTDLKMPIRAFVGAVDADKGPWDNMHDHQLLGAGVPKATNTFPSPLLAAFNQVMVS